jgi:hypothetical protein
VALDNVGAGVTRLANFTGAAQTYLEGPLTFATNNAGELEDTSNTTLGHIDHKYFAPWDHKNPVGHYTNIGLGYVGLGATIMRDAK